MDSCIYCGTPADRLTDEHVISEGLGCKEVLPKSVCERCNSVFGHTFEAKAVNDLTFFRNLLRIPGKEGQVPSYRCSGRINDQDVEVTFSGNGEVIIPNRRIGQINDVEATERQYLVFRKKEEHIIEHNLRRRHSDLIWKRRPGDAGRAIVEVRAEFDARVLCTIEMGRTVAKYGLNLIAEVFGLNASKASFEELRRFIRTGQYTGPVPAGIIWDQKTLRHVPSVPPKHIFILFRDGRANQIVLFISIFSLFPFCVVANDLEIRTDAFNSRTIDPYIGRFTPLIATRALPEATLAHVLSQMPRGDLKQAIPAAKFAHRWVMDASEKLRSGDGEHVVCYECGRILGPNAAICTYCGKDPLPATAASGT